MVSVYSLDIDDLETIRSNSVELDKSVRTVEKHLLSLPNSLALDYILKFPRAFRRERSAELETRRNKLTVQLKNAVMQMWLQVKEKNKKPDFNEILKKIIKMKKDEAKNKKNAKSSKLIKPDEPKELSPRS